jgi:hypothetical protein
MPTGLSRGAPLRCVRGLATVPATAAARYRRPSMNVNVGCHNGARTPSRLCMRDGICRSARALGDVLAGPVAGSATVAPHPDRDGRSGPDRAPGASPAWGVNPEPGVRPTPVGAGQPAQAPTRAVGTPGGRGPTWPVVSRRVGVRIRGRDAEPRPAHPGVRRHRREAKPASSRPAGRSGPDARRRGLRGTQPRPLIGPWLSAPGARMRPCCRRSPCRATARRPCPTWSHRCWRPWAPRASQTCWASAAGGRPACCSSTAWGRSCCGRTPRTRRSCRRSARGC